MKTRILVMTVSLALGTTVTLADPVAKPGITPVQAELVADVHARLLKVGATVYARVTADWKGSDCVLRSGAILEGHVLSVTPQTKTVKSSEVSLVFTRAQCGELKMGTFELLLAAMAAPPEDHDLSLLSENLPVSAPTPGPGGLASVHSLQASALNLKVETGMYEFPMTPNMRMGYVSGIRDLTLSVGTGPDDSSVLTSKKHDVVLLRHTLLLLVPTQGTFPRAAANPETSADPATSSSTSASPSSPLPVQPAAQPPVDDIDLCAPPQCNVALPSSEAIDTGGAAASISIRQLGYAPRPQKEMEGFDRDEALAYLGPRELLVTFNPHKLVSRHDLGSSGSTVRVIRAVVLDTETHQVTHTVDWELPDNRQYLWPFSDGRVLVHVGSELRVYGQGLEIQNRVSFDGPLAFVRVTPDGSFLVAGVIRERHSPELHAQLSRDLNGAPEEDVTILVLNRNFETIAKSNTRSGMMAPTLLNEGQATLHALPNMRYRLSMHTWDDHSWTVAQFNSSCTPEVSSIAPDLIFLVSCNKQTQGREYRVLRSNGKLALKGDSTLNECGHAAEGSANLETFVVKIVQASLPAPPGALLSAADLSSEQLGVYRAADGKRLLGVRVGSPSLSRDGYALAPDGAQLAVLTRDQIAVYSVPVR